MNELDTEDLFRILNALANDPCLLVLFSTKVDAALRTQGYFDFETHDVSEKGYAFLRSCRAA